MMARKPAGKPAPTGHRVTITGTRAECTCGWAHGPLRAVGIVPAADRAVLAGRAHVQHQSNR
jgi:hypothetical protein